MKNLFITFQLIFVCVSFNAQNNFPALDTFFGKTQKEFYKSYKKDYGKLKKKSNKRDLFDETRYITFLFNEETQLLYGIEFNNNKYKILANNPKINKILEKTPRDNKKEVYDTYKIWYIHNNYWKLRINDKIRLTYNNNYLLQDDTYTPNNLTIDEDTFSSKRGYFSKINKKTNFPTIISQLTNNEVKNCFTNNCNNKGSNLVSGETKYYEFKGQFVDAKAEGKFDLDFITTQKKINSIKFKLTFSKGKATGDFVYQILDSLNLPIAKYTGKLKNGVVAGRVHIEIPRFGIRGFWKRKSNYATELFHNERHSYPGEFDLFNSKTNKSLYNGSGYLFPYVCLHGIPERNGKDVYVFKPYIFDFFTKEFSDTRIFSHGRIVNSRGRTKEKFEVFTISHPDLPECPLKNDSIIDFWCTFYNWNQRRW